MTLSMNRQIANWTLLLVCGLCFAEIFTVASANSKSMTIEFSVTPSTPMPSPTRTAVLFSEMVTSVIQPSSTFSEAATEKFTPAPTTVTKPYSAESQTSTMTPLMITTTVSIILGPSTAPTPTTEIPNTTPTDPLTTTETIKIVKEDTTEPMLLPIHPEILALIAIGLSGMSCCCVTLFSFACILKLICRGSKKSQQAKRELQDSAFRSATLQRPLGDAIRSIAVENPTFKELSHDMELKDNMSTINRKDSSVNGYSW